MGGENGYFPIYTLPLWKDTLMNPGTSMTSDPIDLRDRIHLGVFSLSHQLKGTGGQATSGTCGFIYLGCATRDGNYITPSQAGTVGTGKMSTAGTDILPFTPELMPFMKMKCTVTGVAGQGVPVLVTAELNVQ